MNGALVGDSISWSADCEHCYVLGFEPDNDDGTPRRMDEAAKETEEIQTQCASDTLFSFSSHKVLMMLCNAREVDERTSDRQHGGIDNGTSRLTSRELDHVLGFEPHGKAHSICTLRLKGSRRSCWECAVEEYLT